MKYDVVATIGTYEKEGQTKYLTRNVGRVIETKNGLRLKMDASFNPAGCKQDDDGSIWLALFEPKSDKPSAHMQAKADGYQPPVKTDEPPLNDEIPF